jgi:hypothetical protein
VTDRRRTTNTRCWRRDLAGECGCLRSVHHYRTHWPRTRKAAKLCFWSATTAGASYRLIFRRLREKWVGEPERTRSGSVCDAAAARSAAPRLPQSGPTAELRGHLAVNRFRPKVDFEHGHVATCVALESAVSPRSLQLRASMIAARSRLRAFSSCFNLGVQFRASTTGASDQLCLRTMRT